MSKRLVTSALAQFTAKTAGRNMTKAAYAAVAAGVAAMVVLTVVPAYEAAHHWVDAVLWACLAYFVFEWLVRLRHMAGQGRLSLYALSGSGVVDAIGALAVPAALLSGIEPRTAWLLSILWVLKVVPGIPGLRQLRRVLVLESGPLLSVLVIFLMVVFLASVAEYFLERDVQPATFGSVPAALWWAVVTLTTTGYGDVVPITPHGRGAGHDLRPRRVRALDRHSGDRLCGRDPPRQFPENVGDRQQGARNYRRRGPAAHARK